MAPVPDFSALRSSLITISNKIARRNEVFSSSSSAYTSSGIQRRAITSSDYNPGLGSKSPDEFNNKAYFALFGILGAAMVVATIWFFFWAKNGGFVWRQNDWDDYKSTVLRRKGPDGKTLSNATKSTRLGQQSIAGTFSDYGRDEKMAGTEYGGYKSERKSGKKSRPHRSSRREPSDEDMRAYRHEKPAMVGGLNRQADGSHFDYSAASRSDLGSNLSSQPLRPKPASPKKKGFMEKRREKKEVKKQAKQPNNAKAKDQNQAAPPTQRRPSFSTVETSTIGDFSEHYGSTKDDFEESSYYDAYRPPKPQYARDDSPRRHHSPRHQSPHRSSPAGSAEHSRRTSPTKYATKKTYDALSEAESGRGTRTYTHHMPDLGRGDRGTGYRRDAFGGRRDSLSDSDGDLGTVRY